VTRWEVLTQSRVFGRMWPPTRDNEMIQFQNYDGTYSGQGPDKRMWRITPTFTGWHLEFRDPGDMTATNAGRHSTLAAAQKEADR
jgi:hypothetical protein